MDIFHGVTVLLHGKTTTSIFFFKTPPGMEAAWSCVGLFTIRDKLHNSITHKKAFDHLLLHIRLVSVIITTVSAD